MKLAALALALLLAGCSNTLGPADAYQRGAAALMAGDARTARVELLNVIKAHPDNKAARIMQARIYLALRDGVAAEAEVDRARSLGVPAAITRPLKAHALLLQDRPSEALGALGDAADAQSERIRGRALAALGDPDAAAAAFERALAMAPRDGDLLVDTARFRRSIGDIGAALDASDRAVATAPRNADALALRGELTRSQYGLRAALPWFDRAIEIDDRNVTARLERAATLGDMGAMHEMLAETRRVLARSPGNPMAYYLQAMLAARAGNFALARSLYQRTQGRLDSQPAVMLLAGTIDYMIGDPRAAAARLAPLVDMQPDNPKARRLLAAAQWRSGDAAAALATIRPIADRPDADSYSLALAGNVLARIGNRKDAALYLTRAANPFGRGSAALFDAPADSAQLAALRGEALAKPDDAEAQVALIRALLSAGLGSEALARARALAAANPGAPDTYLLVGDSLGTLGDFAGAAEEYRKAANIAFTEPVALRLVEALQRSGHDGAAVDVLNLFLGQNPANVPAQLLAAARFMEARRWDDAIRIYEHIRRQIGDSDAVMLNNLAWAYSAREDYVPALSAARRAWLLDRANPATADTLGWILVKSGRDKARGLVLLAQAARDAPANPQIRAHLQAAR
ncbi:MAG: tetratricopeptide repeat protein [Sphingomonadales bacterium]